MAYPSPKVELVGSNIIRVYHPEPVEPRTYLTATVAAAGTTLTVRSNSGFSNTDPQDLLLIGKLGIEDAEIQRVNGAITAGTSLTVQALTFAHGIDTVVQKILFDHIEIRGSNTDAATAASTNGTIVQFDGNNTNLINISGEYTDFIVTGTTFSFYGVRFYNSLATTPYYGAFSDGVGDTGRDFNTVGYIRRNAFANQNEKMEELYSSQWVYDQIFAAENDIKKELRQGKDFVSIDTDIGNLSTGDISLALPSGIEDSTSNKSILGLRIGKRQNLTYVNQAEYQTLMDGVAFSTLSSAVSTNATSMTLANSRDFNMVNSLGTNLVGYWKFDENTGTTAFDSTTNTNDGTITGATYVTGNSGHALDFDGTNDIVTVTDDSAFQNIFDAGGAISVWINPDSDGENDLGHILEKDGVWNLRVASESGGNVEVVFEVGFSGTNGVWSTAVVVPIDSWTHVVVVYNADATTNDPTIYINGASVTVTEDTTPVGTRTTDVGSDLNIGNNTATTRSFDGTIDELRLYSSSLVPSNVSTLNSNPGGGNHSVTIYSNGVGYTVTYTDIDFSSGVLMGVPYSGDGSVTTSLASGSNVFQDITSGEPTRYTIDDGSILFNVPISSEFNGRNVWMDYYIVPARVDSDGDALTVSDPGLIQLYLEMMIRKRKNNGSLPVDDPTVLEYEKRKIKYLRNELSGQSVQLIPAVPDSGFNYPLTWF